MEKKQTRRLTRKDLRDVGRNPVPTLLTVLGLLCVSLQVFLTNYVAPANRVPLFISVIILLCIQISEIVHRNPSRAWKIGQHLILYPTVGYIYGFLLPLPTPYMIFFVILAILTYFDFGLQAAYVGMSLLFIYLVGRYEWIHGLNSQDASLSMLVALYAVTMTITFYALSFLRFAEKELQDVEVASDEAAIREQQVQSLINNITDGVIAVDHTFKVVIYNAAALDVLDVNTAVKGKSIGKILQPIDSEGHPVSIKDILKAAARPTTNRDLRVQYADGSTANLFIGIAPIYLGYGKADNNGYTLILRDITREKSLEEERDEFISVVSHELRTPIAISEGNISNAQFVAEKGGDMAGVKTALDEAHKQVLFLADMINDLSTLSRAERGVLQVDAEPIDIKSFMAELTDNYTPQANAKGLQFACHVDEAVSTLNSSKLYVREVLQNFITNAIKYTETGSVTISAKPGNKGIVFEVSDTGIGISKGDQERVYDKFFRSEDFRTRQNSGTGLGLYVTMKLARLLHATISLESELNKGSTFTVTIPDFETATVPLAAPQTQTLAQPESVAAQ